MPKFDQLKLFHVTQAYNNAGNKLPLSNDALYGEIASIMGWPRSYFEEKEAVGFPGQPHSLAKRRVRWMQQTLKHLGVLEKVGRSSWKLAEKNKGGLHVIPARLALEAFSTHLGIALWSNCSVLRQLHEPVHLCVTSPPYPLKKNRTYGGSERSQAWVDFLCVSMEPIVANLVPGGSIVLNISNDIFEDRSPARSLYVERMVLALHERLGLSLMDRIPWVNKSKPPGPTYWACGKRVQLAVAWEHIFWFTDDPHKVRSNNTRVLEPHTEKHQKLMKQGGERRQAVYGDGAYTLRPGSFGSITDGRIPRNVIERGHVCADSLRIREAAKLLGLPPHPAMFPTAIPEFFIRFLTDENELVVDPFAGAFKTCLAAENLGRRWIGTEHVLEYVFQAGQLFA